MAAAAVAAVVAAVAAVAAWATVALEAGDAAPDAIIGRGNRTRQSDAGEAPGGAVGASHNPSAAILSLFSCEDCGAQYRSDTEFQNVMRALDICKNLKYNESLLCIEY